MANTYTQLYIHFVFAVQNRTSLIQPEWEEELYKYITGITRNYKHKMIAINGMPDHLHVFLGLHPNQSMSELMRIMKGESSEWINSKKLIKGKFSWQEGYGAFSYGRSQIDQVYNYVTNQKKHHEKRSFKQEYTELLKLFKIEFDERYTFHEIE